MLQEMRFRPDFYFRWFHFVNILLPNTLTSSFQILLEGKFRLDDLVNGRIDLMCRLISSSLFISHDMRRNTICWLVVKYESKDQGEPDPQQYRTFEIRGKEVRRLRVDERNIALQLQHSIWFHLGYESELS
jgi:tRNA pseudouridine-54 N-methylase